MRPNRGALRSPLKSNPVSIPPTSPSSPRSCRTARPAIGSRLGRNTRRDPRVATSIVDCANPYAEVQTRARVVKRRLDSDFMMMDAVSRITPRRFLFCSPEGRVALIIEVDRVRYTKLAFEHTAPKK
jgi:hypothetical protein